MIVILFSNDSRSQRLSAASGLGHESVIDSVVDLKYLPMPRVDRRTRPYCLTQETVLIYSKKRICCSLKTPHCRLTRGNALAVKRKTTP